MPVGGNQVFVMSPARRLLEMVPKEFTELRGEETAEERKLSPGSYQEAATYYSEIIELRLKL